MKDNSWTDFCNTGSIEDYLKYKENEKAKENDDFNQGFSNKRADNRGE
ncbi:MAG: hypothetical protein ACI4IQ_05480 [Eubacterium sp.]